MTLIDIAELQIALEAAQIAGERIRTEYERFTPIPDAPADISTAIDLAAQELILSHLVKHFPNDAFCAEENTPGKTNAGSSPRAWVVDPIDGTRGFAKKNGEFTVMIGMLADGIPTVGVVLEPVTMTYTFAARGRGCWTRQGDAPATRCRVREVADPSEAILVQSHSRPGKPTRVAGILQPQSIREMYSAGLKMAWIARGLADVYINTYDNFSDWDICAGDILVSEAGGIVTGIRGEQIRYGQTGFRQKRGMIAANASIHPAIVQALAAMEWP